MNTLIGDHIRTSRQRHNMSLNALADRLLVSKQAVSAWEHGVRLPSLSNLDKLCLVFGWDLADVADMKQFDKSLPGQTLRSAPC